MADGELERMTRARDTLRTGGLGFCTRCGSQVESYQPSESLGHDEYGDYEQPLVGDAALRQPGDCSYRCPVCQARWYAVGWKDTGCVLSCGHFMPVYAAYCGLCGSATITSNNSQDRPT